MKKILQLAAVMALSLTAVEGKAQLANGSIAPDFTFTDIAGATQHLYAYLDAGKTVYIDVSAAWCGPCWAYHNSGNLENLYNTYGPSGTDELMVLFVEGELTNTGAQLTGTNAGSTYATASQGDWTLGTPYPMIDLSSATPGASAFLSGYAIGYFPTIYMICPDRSITEVGQETTANLYAAKSSCSMATAAVDAEMMLSSSLNSALASCDSVTPTFRIGNVGTSTLTSATITYKVDGVLQKTFSWSGSLATYGNTTVTGVKVGSSTPGTHTITAEISNPNGGTDPTISNNATTANFTIYPTVGGALVVEPFESAGIPSSWSINNGGDAATWEDATTGYSSSKSMTLNWFAIPSGDVDIITLDPMSFASASSPSMTFDVSYCQYSSESDNLKVEVSTNCGSTWSTKYNKSGSTLSTHAASTSSWTPSAATDWRHETVNLSSYAGMSSVLVRFKGTSNYGNNVYVDNINVTGVTGINENNMITGVSVYPNPISSTANVDFNLTEANNVSISMMNALGQVIMTEDLGSLPAGTHTYGLDATSMSNGLYFVNITVGNKTIAKKVSINK